MCHSRGPEQNSENIEPVMLLDIHTTGYMHWKHWKSSGFVYIKVTISIKIVGFFPLTDQEHMDITKMAAMR